MTTKLQRKARPGGQKNYIKTASKIIKIETNNLGDLLKKTYYLRDAQGNVMSIYTLDQLITPLGEPEVLGLKLTERSIYGSSRVGTENPELLIARTDLSLAHEFDYVQTIGDRRYELSNHLGNVLEVVSDRKLQRETAEGSGVLDYYTADVISQSDYFPFGMMLPNRNESGDEYRYGFNGMEKDDEVSGDGNSYDFGARFYNPRVGRFLSGDPRESDYPFMSIYCYAANSPIRLTDLNGEGPIIPFQSLVVSQKVKSLIEKFEAGEITYEELESVINSYLGMPFTTYENLDYAERKLEEGGIEIYKSGDAKTKDGIWLVTSPEVAYVAGEKDDAVLYITLIQEDEAGEWVEVHYEIVGEKSKQRFADQKLVKLKKINTEIQELEQQIEDLGGEVERGLRMGDRSNWPSKGGPVGGTGHSIPRGSKVDSYNDVGNTIGAAIIRYFTRENVRLLKAAEKKLNKALLERDKIILKLRQNENASPGVSAPKPILGKPSSSDRTKKNKPSNPSGGGNSSPTQSRSHTHHI